LNHYSPASYSYFRDKAFMPRLAKGSKGAVTNWKSMKPMIMGLFSAFVNVSKESLKPNDRKRAFKFCCQDETDFNGSNGSPPLLMNRVNSQGSGEIKLRRHKELSSVTW
jgi:hypothetical protein